MEFLNFRTQKEIQDAGYVVQNGTLKNLDIELNLHFGNCVSLTGIVEPKMAVWLLRLVCAIQPKILDLFFKRYLICLIFQEKKAEIFLQSRMFRVGLLLPTIKRILLV